MDQLLKASAASVTPVSTPYTRSHHQQQQQVHALSPAVPSNSFRSAASLAAKLPLELKSNTSVSIFHK
jgi:hypothetical protein